MRSNMQKRPSSRLARALAVLGRSPGVGWLACALVAGGVACGSSSGSGGADSGRGDATSMSSGSEAGEDGSPEEAATGSGEGGAGPDAGADGEAGTPSGGSCSAFLGSCGASGGTCCDGMVCGGNNHYCCVYDGFLAYEGCTFDTNCCSGHCEQPDSGAVYGLCCYIKGQTCQYATDCCPGLSCGAQSVCE